jgi:hypothetical protein
LHTLKIVVDLKHQKQKDMTRNFPTFNGPAFSQNGIQFTFLMNHPKKDAFIYEVGKPATNEYSKQAAIRQDWFDCQFNHREMMKFINRQLGGKLSGESKTTMSLYSILKSGLRVRVSDHSAFCRRSQSDVYIIIGGRTGSPSISVNDSKVSIDWASAMANSETLFSAVCDAVISEIEFLNSNN